MEWRDEGTLLSVRKHGEGQAIIEVFTAEHGRHLGVVRGGGSRRMAPLLQPGARLDLSWRARLDQHIGAFTVEPLQSRAALVIGDRLALAGLNALVALLSFSLPERAPHPGFYARTELLFDGLGHPDWRLAYLRWELLLLEEMGFGLDLGDCAVTGTRDDLAFVSPRTGRAVSREAAGTWAPRLLRLPPCLLGQGPASAADIADGLRLTGHFLASWLAAELGDRPLPPARQRLIDSLARETGAAP